MSVAEQGNQMRAAARDASSAADLPQLITMRRTTEMCSISRQEIYRRLAMIPPQFPEPIKLSEDGAGPRGQGRGHIRFLLSEVRAWIEERAAARRSKRKPESAVQQMSA